MAAKVKNGSGVDIVSIDDPTESAAFIWEVCYTVRIGAKGRQYQYRAGVFRKGGGPVVQTWDYQRSAGVTGRAFLAFLRSDAGVAAWTAAETAARETAAKYPGGIPAWAGAKGGSRSDQSDIDIG